MASKRLKIPFLSSVNQHASLSTVSSVLDSLDRSNIEFSPWQGFSYLPEAAFTIAYNDYFILLKYYVREESIRAKYNKINDPVYKDSCVEFFIAFGDEESYYNLEFNCTGNCLAGFGPDRDNRKLLQYSSVRKIRSETLIWPFQNKGCPFIKWELTIMIPFDVFSFHKIDTLKGRSCKANFYKCGDELPKPHYLSWNNIIFDFPNFHLSGFFGELQF